MVSFKWGFRERVWGDFIVSEKKSRHGETTKIHSVPEKNIDQCMQTKCMIVRSGHVLENVPSSHSERSRKSNNF